MYKFIVIVLANLLIMGCNEPKGKKQNVTENIITGTKQEIISYKPAYHFTADSNWINDPNGLVYYEGQYHLFYQYNPFGSKWGHMSWGHSVSTDLLHWKTLPVALFEEKNKNDMDTTMIFSGSAVVDKNNSGGFGTEGKPSMVAIYTSFVHNNQKAIAQHQSIAYSNDRGITWTKYTGNPVLDIKSPEFRDPKVSWYEPQQKWVMVVSKPDEHETWFYESKNLKNWSFLSKWGKTGDTARVWECPDLIELNVEGTSQKKWVLISSAGHPNLSSVGMQYFIGDFDGKKFTAAENYLSPVYLDFGKDYYAAVSFNDAPGSRKIMVGWLNNWDYANDIPTGNVWRGAFSIPREIKLIKWGNDFKLIQQPVAELNAFAQEVFSLNEKTVDTVFDLSFKGNAYQLELVIEPGTAKTAGINILKSKGEETVLKYDAGSKQFLLDRMKSGNISFNNKFPVTDKVPVVLKDGKLKLKILVDKCIVEVFINDGETTITDLVFPVGTDGGIQLFSDGGKSTFSSLKISTIKM